MDKITSIETNSLGVIIMDFIIDHLFNIGSIFWEFLSFLWSILQFIVMPMYYGLPAYEPLEVTECRKRLCEATDYQSWYKTAIEFDRLMGNDKWKAEEECYFYDYKFIKSRLEALRNARKNVLEDPRYLMDLLLKDLVRGIAGTTNPELYYGSLIGTKNILEMYFDEFANAIRDLSECKDSDFAPLSKRYFFRDLLQVYGKTGLSLSGGGTMCLFHLGIVKTLFEQKILPRVISGSSTGALVVAVVGVHDDDELGKVLIPGYVNFGEFRTRQKSGSLARKIERLFKHGVLNDISVLKNFCLSNIGNLTFLEGYRLTNRVINIMVGTTNKDSTIALNYITAPNVLIWSAALAACAAPLLYNSVTLMAKDYNGNTVPWNTCEHMQHGRTLDSDLISSRLSELFNVNNVIVSQVNPHAVPFVFDLKRNIVRTPSFIGKLLRTLKVFFLREIHFFTIIFCTLFPSLFAYLQIILTNKYVGDITIVPELSFMDYFIFVQNPSYELAKKCFHIGERSAWKYVSLIKLNLRIEIELHDCINRLLEKKSDDVLKTLDFRDQFNQ